MAADGDRGRIRITRWGRPAPSDVADGVDADLELDRFEFRDESVAGVFIRLSSREDCPSPPLRCGYFAFQRRMGAA
jgi:hypothetical protein